MIDVLPFALSVQQPWAHAILRMGKDIENRTWAPPDHIVGHRVWIHASKKRQPIEPWELLGQRFTLDDDDVPELDELPLGKIVGSVRIIGSTGLSSSRWFSGPIGWQLADPVPLDTPVACRGMLGVWRVPQDVLAELAA